MPAALRIKLTSEEDKTLQELSLADNVARRVRMRAIALRLNADGLTVPTIAAHLHIMNIQFEPHYDDGKTWD
ncbi:MAG: helix-turn-helix domain-containing protein [Nostoc sp. DedSLP03]|uniref:helix-turn-helix domain-containing protein n=1 Tax=Nostoc sp. DedSLP03 TaxID=3075400 RepID=UPI002AD353FD|nr:helix-turn-helix domain-containing protein [Nostoc sp. DedSLP03]MDZ7970280.1 helix-turn-helix domain-containing protein [Nostoc sp. DedSLP03]